MERVCGTFLIVLLVLAGGLNDVFAGKDTGPNSPLLRFQVVKKWLTPDGMRLMPGEIYSGKRYPRNVNLSVAGISVVVPSDYVVVVEGGSSAPVTVEEIKAKEQQGKLDARELQRKNPEFHAYLTGKMSEADRKKLEAKAQEAGLSVEDYTSLSPLDRYKAIQAKKSSDR
jgi:hypothetical protein